MNTIANKIVIADLADNVFDLNTLISETKESIVEENLLVNKIDIPDDISAYKQKNQAFGRFEDDLWVIKNTLNSTFNYFDFGELKGMIFIGVSDELISLLKCWVADRILTFTFEDNEGDVHHRHAVYMRSVFKNIVKFIETSSNFDTNFLESKKGSQIEYFISHLNETRRYIFKFELMNLLDFLLDKVSDEHCDRLSAYLRAFAAISIEPPDSKPRLLPKSTNLLLFTHYIEMFFYNLDTDISAKILYMPILLWWKITTVIPMRPSEFCAKIPRKCLVEEDGNYFLIINRIKQQANLNKKLLPVLKRVKITEELYVMIKEYIRITDGYPESENLLSYAALLDFRQKHTNSKAGSRKFYQNRFSTGILRNLLDSFYDDIIVGKYNDNRITERVKLGDTRHIAFTSLILQGYSPVEIAIIGGHRTLSTLDNYTCSVNSYIDTEVMSVFRKNIKLESKGYSKARCIFDKMSKECAVPMVNCIEAEIDDEELGYCTIIKTNPRACNQDDCLHCDYWWCKPTEYNFLKLEKILKNRYTTKTDKLERDLAFMLTLLNEVGLDVIDDRLTVNQTVAQGLRRVSLELESNAKSVINLKYQMVHGGDNGMVLVSDIEDLIPLNDVNKFIEKKVREIDNIIYQK